MLILKKNLIVTLILLLCFSKVRSQSDTLHIHQYADTLASVGDAILKSKTDSARIANHELFKLGLDTLLKQNSSFQYSFSSVKNLSVLTSDDKKVRVYTWMLPTQRGMLYEYSGYVQVYDAVKKKIR